MDTAIIGGIVGGVLGIVGGVVGTCFSIRNTHGPRERRFMIRAAVLGWFALGLTALTAYLLPSTQVWAGVPILVMLVVGIPVLNRRHQKIRREEARD